MKITIKTKDSEIVYEDQNTYSWTVQEIIMVLKQLMSQDDEN